MASNFFEQQDAARKKTGYLIGLFGLAVLGITLLLYIVVLIAMGWLQGNQVQSGGVSTQVPYVGAFVATLIGVSVVVGGASLVKIATLRSGGGEAVAQMMGGRLLHPHTRDLDERKVMNVVEEMALASGTPVPPVYLMEHESGINAFAAGYSPDKAVIGITRGAIEKLTRDELQGVVAHEFSHILNGDMRMNIRLMGVIYGIIVIAVIGRVLVRAGFYSSGSRRDKDARAAIAIGFAGLALMAIGGIGVVAGRLIQAAVSRQREFLADASAVQFTRNPDSIGGALKRIGGVGSSIRNGHADEVGHMCIASAMSNWGFSMFATHPPLDERIRRIDPAWDGRYTDPNEPLNRRRKQAKPATKQQRHQASMPLGVPAGGAVGGLPGAIIGAAVIADALNEGAVKTAAIDQVGQISSSHVAYMRDLLDRIPQALKQAAHDPQGAQAVVFAVLLDQDTRVRAEQLQTLAMQTDPAITKLTQSLAEQAAALPKEARLPLIDLSVPALREMSQQSYSVFKGQVSALTKADGRVDLFEWVLQRVLVRHLDLHFVSSAVPRVKYAEIKPLAKPCVAVLSALSHLGHGDPAEAGKAFAAGLAELGLVGLDMQDRSKVRLIEVGQALDELMLASNGVKERVVRACARAIALDGEVTRGEGELMRAVADSLAVPMPPILPGQKLV